MLKITVETDEGTEVIDLSAEEQKAFEYRCNMPIDHIRTNILNQIRVGSDEITTFVTDKNPAKMLMPEKLLIVKDADIKSAKERQEEFEAGTPE